MLYRQKPIQFPSQLNRLLNRLNRSVNALNRHRNATAAIGSRAR
jgi:hypothetical protein